MKRVQRLCLGFDSGGDFPLNLLAKGIVGHIRFDLAQAKVTQEKCVHGCADETHYERNAVRVA